MTIDKSYRLLQLCDRAVQHADGEHQVVFDLRKTTTVDSFAVVMLARTIKSLLNEGTSVAYYLPDHEECRASLFRMGFASFFHLSGDRYPQITDRTCQLSALNVGDAGWASRVVEIISRNIDASHGVQDFLHFSLNELLTNAYDHSQTSEPIYACVDSFYSEYNQLRVCVSDLGVGIKEALATREEYQP